MTYTPVAGQFGVVQVTPGNTPIEVPSVNWDLKVNSNAKDVSNFRDGRKRWPTLQDWSMSLTLVWDSAANPLIAANGGIVPGAFVGITAFVSTANTTNEAWVGNGIVSSVNPKDSGVEDVIMYDCVIDANGIITPPSV